MKFKPWQWINELALCSKSPTLNCWELRKHYISLLLQSIYKTDDKKPYDIDFMGRRLRCFDCASVLSLFREIFVYQHYNIPVSLPEEPIIFDVGANIGMFSIYASLVHKNSIINAFEAVPETAEVLQSNLDAFCLNNVKLHSVAVSDREGTEVISIAHNDINHCCATMEVKKPTGRIFSVSSVCLSRFLLNYPVVDFLKMDVEGAEYRAITEISAAGALDHVRSLAMEVHTFPIDNIDDNSKSLGALISALERSGFLVDFFAQANRPFTEERLSPTFMIRAKKK